MDFNNYEIQKALDELEIDIELTKVDEKYIKQKYHRLALKWHPDKNKDPYATEKFQKINEAYDFLIINMHYEPENLNTSYTFVSLLGSKESKLYIDILSNFISSLIKGTYNETVINIIKEISLGYEVITLAYLRHKMDGLDKQKVIDLYQLLYKYKEILYISNDILELVSTVIKEKCTNNQIFILKPTLKDILNHNIYKLYVDEQLYLVPLWHNELYFDAVDGSDIIVLCQPKLPTNISIDENNNLYVEMGINISELHLLLKGDAVVSLNLGEKCFSIPLHKLCIKEEQFYTLKGQGIARISEKDIYNINNKSDITVKITLHSV